MKKRVWFLLCVILLSGCLTLGAGAAADVASEDAAVSLLAADNGEKPADEVVDFGMVWLSEGTVAFAAVYDGNGRMLFMTVVTPVDNRITLTVPGEVYAEMKTAKLFRLSTAGYVPIGSASQKEKPQSSDIETPRF